MKCKILTGAVLLMAAFSISETRATSCARLPSCEQLGYTMTKAECGDVPVIHCPFALTDDNQIFCRKEVRGEIAVNIGDILYGDGTVSTGIISGKTPIGIVFDPANRLAMALTDVKQNGSAGTEEMDWSVNNYDIPNLENCSISISYAIVSCGVDGRANTNAILACGDNCGGTPAATACNLYQPSGCTKDFCKKGKWFLPSVRDLNNIYLQENLINVTLIALGKGKLPKNDYWSSTENNDHYAWHVLSFYSIHSFSGGKGIEQFFVRPVIAF